MGKTSENYSLVFVFCEVTSESRHPREGCGMGTLPSILV